MITHPFFLLFISLSSPPFLLVPLRNLSRSKHPRTAVRENGSRKIERQGSMMLDMKFWTLEGLILPICVIAVAIAVAIAIVVCKVVVHEPPDFYHLLPVTHCYQISPTRVQLSDEWMHDLISDADDMMI
jgi:hypothetical protein